ncbi:MAG: hypothetical protein MUO19_00740 [Dehalococcoidales bacterium]|nr:hypothetical protein [Dehalococcoidales bacterium]
MKALCLKGRRVRKWQSAPLEEGLVRDGLILQPARVGAVIDTLLKDMGVPRNRVIAGIAGLSFTYRFLSLPRMKPAALGEAILRAVKKEISIPPEELNLSWQAVSGTREEQTFFVLGVPKNLMVPAEETLKAARIEPYLMDLRPLALARAANRGEAIAVNPEPDSVDIVFIAGGVPTVIHTIRARGEGATLDDNVRRVSDEIAKMAAFYQGDRPGAGLSESTPLLLTGELAAQAAVPALFQAEVGYPVELLSPPVDASADFPAVAYGVNVGLALKHARVRPAAPEGDARFQDINLNILNDQKPRLRVKQASRPVTFLYVLMAVLALLAYPLFLVTGDIRAENVALQEQVRNLPRELSLATLEAEEDAQKEQELQELLVQAASYEEASRQVLDSRGVTTRLLDLVNGALPASVLFNSYDIGERSFIIRGEAGNEFLVVDYATALESLDLFRDVRINQLNERGATGAVIFEILVKP